MKGKGKKILRKAGILLLSLGMITGFVLLFVAASKDRNRETCKGMEIALRDSGGAIFVDREAIRDFINKDKHLNPVGKDLSALNIQLLERSVETYPWVKSAELFLDNQAILQVHITQRTPLARVFTRSGHSFYIDTEGRRVPLTERATARVPVITGFPSDGPRFDAADSLLYREVIALSRYLKDEDFWMAQVDQVNINAQGDFELIPKVGGQLIVLGDATALDRKFSKLMTFYRQGLNNLGWGYYDTLNLSFAGQVVASRRHREGNPIIRNLYTQGGYGADGGTKIAAAAQPDPAPPAMPEDNGDEAPATRVATNREAPKALYRGSHK